MEKFYNHYDVYGYTTDVAVRLKDSLVNSWFKKCENLAEEASLEYAKGSVHAFNTAEEAIEDANETNKRISRR